MAALLPEGKQSFTDGAGMPLVGGKLYTYDAGTNNPRPTYSDAAGTVPNTNPVVLDARGEAAVFWVGAYKVILKDAAGNTIWTVDGVVDVAGSLAVDLASTATGKGAALVGFKATGGQPETVADALSQTVRLWDYMTSAQKADVTAGTMLVDCASAWDAAMAAFPESASTPDSYAYSCAGTLELPQGTIYLASTRNITRGVRIVGKGGGRGNALGGTRLAFPANAHGLVVHAYNTGGTGKGADGTLLEGFAVIVKTWTGSAAPASGSYHGVWLRSQCHADRVYAAGFSGHGFNVVATAGGGGSLEGNTNLTTLNRCVSVQNGTHGFYVTGADANVVKLDTCDARGNGGWGYYEDSFLGNRYENCHAATNVSGPFYNHKSNNTSTYTNCYTEGGQPSNDMVCPSAVWVGGTDGAGFTPGSTIQRFDYTGAKVKAAASAAAPSYSIVSDPTTGLYQVGTASGVWAWSSLGNERARLGNGWAKFSTDGTYWSSAQAACEFVQTATGVHSAMAYAKTSAYAGLGMWSRADTAAGTGFNLFTGTNAGGVAFQVLGNGNVQNTNNSYAAISDLKLKQDIADASSAWEKIKAYRWVTYSLKADPAGGKLLGVIAQEAEQVSPGVVYETPDYMEHLAIDDDGNEVIDRLPTGTTTKAVKYSVIAMQAAQALGEALKRIEALEAKVAALQGAHL